MRLDEMIIKANADGKTYFCNGTDFEYSKEKGFMFYSETEKRQVSADVVCTDDWKEKPKRRLTVLEAEKELDCVIDTPDISKLFISSDILPEDGLKLVLFGESRRHCYSGFYDALAKAWRTEYSGAMVTKPSLYIKWSDLIKFIPKE